MSDSPDTPGNAGDRLCRAFIDAEDEMNTTMRAKYGSPWILTADIIGAHDMLDPGEARCVFSEFAEGTTSALDPSPPRSTDCDGFGTLRSTVSVVYVPSSGKGSNSDDFVAHYVSLNKPAPQTRLDPKTLYMEASVLRVVNDEYIIKVHVDATRNEPSCPDRTAVMVAVADGIMRHYEFRPIR